MTTELAKFGEPGVFGAHVPGPQDVLPFLRLDGKDKLLVSDAGIGSDADKLGEVDCALLLLHGLVGVVRKINRVVVILRREKCTWRPVKKI